MECPIFPRSTVSLVGKGIEITIKMVLVASYKMLNKMAQGKKPCQFNITSNSNENAHKIIPEENL